MSAAEVRDRLGDRFRLLTGPEHGRDWPVDAAQHGGGDRRPAGRRRTSRAADGVGVCWRLRPARAVRRRRGERRHWRPCGSWTRWCASPSSSPITVRRGPGTASSRPSGRSPTRRSRRRPNATPFAIGTPRTSRTEAAAAMGAVERPRVARRGRLGAGRAGQPAVRLPVERRPWPGRGGDRCRRPCRADGLLGRAVRDDRVGRGIARGGGASRRPTAASAVRRGRVRLLRRAGRGRDRQRSPCRRARGPAGYESASPAMPCSSRRSVRADTPGTCLATSS